MKLYLLPTLPHHIAKHVTTQTFEICLKIMNVTGKLFANDLLILDLIVAACVACPQQFLNYTLFELMAKNFSVYSQL